MATNSTLGGLPGLTTESLDTLKTVPAAIAIAAAIAFLILHLLTPRLDPHEPPLLKPQIPLVGHILGMIRHQAQYHTNLQRASHQPIATLPMLTGKMYAVWDPYLIASGLRSKSLSTTPHTIATTPSLTQVSPETTALLRGPNGVPLVEQIMFHTIPTALKPPHVNSLTTAALSSLAAALTTLSATTTTSIPNTWLHLRDLLTKATTTALYGPTQNPFSPPSIASALWTFEANLLPLALNLPLPLIPGTSAGRRARATLFDALTPYYASRRDTHPTASAFVRHRAATLREGGMGDGDVARVEVMLPFAAVVNTVPVMFWMVGFCFSSSSSSSGTDLVGRLRGEVERELLVGAGRDAEGVARVRTARGVVEGRCPVLMACYRETLRLTVHQVSTRTVVKDTVVSGAAGREYLLKEGAVVQLAAGVGHGMEEYWGADVGEFRPERFLGAEGEGGEGPGSARAVRAAFQPFGGGMHLCPGRYFAFAELVAVMATLLLGFEVEPLEGTEWKLPAFATRSVIDAVAKPARHGEGFGMRVTTRAGWEGVRWEYES